jgi:hypothetical protein
MDFLSRDSQVGIPKSLKLGLSRLWSPITLQADLRLRCSLKQSCSSPWELFNSMLHALCRQINQVDSRLLVVKSQTDNLTPGPSFAHNLCFGCPNEQCEPILDIYAPRAFQWYKELFQPWSFDPLKLPFEDSGVHWDSNSQSWILLGVWGFTPPHFLALPGACGVTPGLPLGPQPCNPFALVASPRLWLWQLRWKHHPNPSLAQMAMEPRSNILMLPFAKILYLVPIDVPTPTCTKVSEPLLDEVLVPPSLQAPTPLFIKYLPHPLLKCLQFLPSWICAKKLRSHQRHCCKSFLNQLRK